MFNSIFELGIFLGTPCQNAETRIARTPALSGMIENGFRHVSKGHRVMHCVQEQHLLQAIVPQIAAMTLLRASAL